MKAIALLWRKLWEWLGERQPSPKPSRRYWPENGPYKFWRLWIAIAIIVALIVLGISTLILFGTSVLWLIQNVPAVGLTVLGAFLVTVIALFVRYVADDCY